MRYILTVMLFAFMSMTAYADSLSSLTLTDTEMQKLKKYFPTDDTSHLTWKGDALSIALPINKEKRIVFPDHVNIDVKGALTADKLRILNNDKSIYLTALKSFSTTRIYVTLKESGEVVLIDLTTDNNAANNTQQVDIKQNNTHTDANNNPVLATVNEASSQASETTTSRDDISIPNLIRFAWQQVYAPKRVIQNSSNISRAPMHTEKFVSDLVYGDKVMAYPESSWMSGNHYVTAVLLRNKYPHITHIDIRKDLCGDWQAATLYPNSTLKPYGDKRSDSAMLFLVSDRSFGETVGVCHGDA
jgi:integrating conjugative element protein (TIGR03749 family)